MGGVCEPRIEVIVKMGGGLGYRENAKKSRGEGC